MDKERTVTATEPAGHKSKSIRIHFSIDEYSTLQDAASLRNLEIEPMLKEVLAPVIKLLRPPNRDD